MRLIRYIQTASVAAALTLAYAGSASAEDVVIDTTGPDSNNEVTVTNSNEVKTSNTSVVQVVNTNLQYAETGDVSAEGNTTVGDLSSGDAANVAETATSVSINNETAVDPGGNPGQGGNPGVNNPGQGGNQGGQPTGGDPGRGQGDVLGASTGGLGAGVETLPVVGPSSPVDVSALRAAWSPSSDSAASKFADKTKAFSVAMLATAGLLSLLGAIASFVYARRQEGRV
jgi:hypothetical protein